MHRRSAGWKKSAASQAQETGWVKADGIFGTPVSAGFFVHQARPVAKPGGGGGGSNVWVKGVGLAVDHEAGDDDDGILGTAHEAGGGSSGFRGGKSLSIYLSLFALN